MTATPQPDPAHDPLEWVRVAIDGLRHSQNIAVGVLGGGMALLAAVFGGFMIWQAGEVSDLGGKLDGIGDRIAASEQRIIARIDTVGRDVVDVRDRVSRLEGQVSGISEQLAKFQRGALEPGFEVLPPGPVDTPIMSSPKEKNPITTCSDISVAGTVLRYCDSADNLVLPPDPKLPAHSLPGVPFHGLLVPSFPLSPPR